MVPFCAGEQQYTLHFKGELGTPMYQQNVKFKTKREIRRRPRFVSVRDVELKLKRWPHFTYGGWHFRMGIRIKNLHSWYLCCSGSSPSTGSSTAVSFPSHWDKIKTPEYQYKVTSYQTVDLCFEYSWFNSSAVYVHCIPLFQLILLSKSEEYNMIETLFKRTMPNSTIHQIQRIQNPSLWKVFQW